METEVPSRTDPLLYFTERADGAGLLMSFSTKTMRAEPLYNHALHLGKHIHATYKFRTVVAPLAEPDNRTATGAWQVEIVTDPLPDDEVNTYRTYIDSARKNGAVGVLVPFHVPRSLAEETFLQLTAFRNVLARELSVSPIAVVVKGGIPLKGSGVLRLNVTDTGEAP